ncbi:sterol desaturase family protein [Daejeonella oryzae]|uniref:sterol desaturase family protein n=1 Tax=Daejeonella oryzae TaxID=1122943 RepID=UPI000427DF41|nr:sterol desaturase family protein [Daejeonella oryzae]
MKVDYIALSVPVFFILIGIELAYALYKKLDYYRLNDSLANLSQGIGSQLIGLFLKTATFWAYLTVFDHLRFYTFPNTIWTWLLLFLGVDFFYYWFHRMSHQINALWAAHIVHHQSEEYNLTVALRQSWFQGGFSWIFYLPLAFAGFDPIMFLTVSSFNTLYQFWIHTRSIGKMGPLEWFMNTPSHHRVHHGSNPKYIDKNHAGSLIIWDRMFGTFQAEEEEVVYGITKPLQSWNPVWANFHYWIDLYQTARKTSGFRDKLNVFIKSPGWFPASLGGMQYPQEIDIKTYRKFSPDYNIKFNKYVLVQFIFALVLATILLFFNSKMLLIQLITSTTLVILTLVTCGALLEQKVWLIKFEYFRLIFWLVSLIFYWNNPYFLSIIIINAIMIIFSVIWFYTLKSKTIYVETTSGL